MAPQELILPFEWQLGVSAFGLCNLACAATCSLGFVVTATREPRSLMRAAFLSALVVHAIFQWPLAGMSPIIERNLESRWLFAFAIHMPVLVGLAWVSVTRGATRNLPSPSTSLPLGTFLALVFVTALLATVYLFSVGPQCTGLYAIIVDPELSLLARETSIKLVGSGVATYSFGALVNVLCPLLLLYSTILAGRAWKDGMVCRVAGYLLLAVAAVVIVVLPGIKGSLVPSVVAVGGAVLMGSRRWPKKALVLVAAVSVSLGVLTSFELVRSREASRIGAGYDYGGCIVRLGACREGIDLLDSLLIRDLSLSIDRLRVLDIRDSAQEACLMRVPAPSPALKGRGEALLSSNGLPESREGRKSGAEVEAPGGVLLQNRATVEEEYRVVAGTTTEEGSDASVSEVASEPGASALERIRLYAGAMVYRAVVVPLQAASWYFKFVEMRGSPGVYALPFARRVFGRSADMSSAVREHFYTAYSGGSAVSTGTVPTSFFLAYPAVLGWYGIALGAFCMVVFDAAAARVQARLRGVAVGGMFGLLLVAALNFSLSDFVTVLVSHGAGLALVLFWGLSFVPSREKKACESAVPREDAAD